VSNDSGDEKFTILTQALIAEEDLNNKTRRIKDYGFPKSTQKVKSN